MSGLARTGRLANPRRTNIDIDDRLMRQAMRSSGDTVRKTIDCLIATFCIRAHHSLIHRARDFDPFEKFLDLTVVHA